MSKRSPEHNDDRTSPKRNAFHRRNAEDEAQEARAATSTSGQCAVTSIAVASSAQASPSGVERIRKRKRDHIDVCLNRPVQPYFFDDCASSPQFRPIWEKYKLPYTALPNCNLADISTATTFLGMEISVPLIVSSMTGGEEYGKTINTNLAIACNSERIPFGVGSMRVMKNNPAAKATFDVKPLCPETLMLANIGLVQLNYGFSCEDVNRLISDVRADGLFVHLNHLQEAVQPEGDTDFVGLTEKLAELAKNVAVPIVAKSVGHGIDARAAESLCQCGVRAIDVSGVGGTSWAWVEGWRAAANSQRTSVGAQQESRSDNLGYVFRDVGITTDECLKECSARLSASPAFSDVCLIAGGGIRNGLDIAKSLTMGASCATAALPFLAASLESPEAVRSIIQLWRHQLKVAMFSAGVSSISELRALRCTERHF